MAVGMSTGGKVALSFGAKAVTAIMEGVQANRMAKFNAAQSRQIAGRDRQVAKMEADDLRQDEDRRRAAVRALRGGANTGTALTLLQDMAGEAEFEALKVEAGGEVNATLRENEARGFEFRGRQKMTSGVFRAGSAILTGASKMKRFGSPSTSVSKFGGFQGM